MAKAVAKKDETALALPLEDLQALAGAGMEEMEREDLKPPRLKLAQALTPELREIEDLKAGVFFNSITQQTFPDINIIPIKFFKTYVLFGPRDSGDNILARAEDGKHWEPAYLEYHHPSLAGVVWKTAKTVKESKLHKFGTSNPADPQSAPAATQFLNFLCVDADNVAAGPFIVSFYRSAIKAGQNFASQMQYSATEDKPAIAWNNTYNLSAVEVRSNKGDYYIPKTRSVGITPDDVWAQCLDMFKSFQGMNVVVEHDDDNETSEAPADTDIPF